MQNRDRDLLCQRSSLRRARLENKTPGYCGCGIEGEWESLRGRLDRAAGLDGGVLVIQSGLRLEAGSAGLSFISPPPDGGDGARK